MKYTGRKEGGEQGCETIRDHEEHIRAWTAAHVTQQQSSKEHERFCYPKARGSRSNGNDKNLRSVEYRRPAASYGNCKYMKLTSLPYHFSKPPARLRKARLDNIALVPASLLPLKETYLSVANSYP